VRFGRPGRSTWAADALPKCGIRPADIRTNRVTFREPPRKPGERMWQAQVWRRNHGAPAPPFGPMPGLRSGATLAYEFERQSAQGRAGHLVRRPRIRHRQPRPGHHRRQGVHRGSPPTRTRPRSTDSAAGNASWTGTCTPIATPRPTGPTSRPPESANSPSCPRRSARSSPHRHSPQYLDRTLARRRLSPAGRRWRGLGSGRRAVVRWASSGRRAARGRPSGRRPDRRGSVPAGARSTGGR
jgi:hypothetical protein